VGECPFWYRRTRVVPDQRPLNGRCCCCSGVSSQTRYITCCVPQGLVLGPVLFLIYINDIGNSISGIPIKLFADDANLFIFSESIDLLKADVEDKLKLLNSWFVANKLSPSFDKTCCSIWSNIY